MSEEKTIQLEKAKCRIIETSTMSEGDCPHRNPFDGSCFSGAEEGECIGMKQCKIVKIITVRE